MIDDIKRRLRAFLHRHDAVVLTYHSILPDPLPFPLWHNLSTEMFDHHMAMLARDFRCVPMSELLQDLAHRHMKPYTVAVTFDDGFRNNLTHALPILKQHQVPATLFITSGFIGGERLLWPEWLVCTLARTPLPDVSFAGQSFAARNVAERVVSFRALAKVFKQFKPEEITQRITDLMSAANVTRNDLESLCQVFKSLTWEELAQMRTSGLFEFGAHTVDHWRLTNLNAEQARQQIVESKQHVEARLGPINYFAYPHGGPHDFDASHRSLAIEAGFQAVFTAMNGTVNSQSDRFALSRYGIGGEMTRDQFSYMLHGGVARMSESDLT